MRMVIIIVCLYVIIFLQGCGGNDMIYNSQQQAIIEGCNKFLQSFNATKGICGDDVYCVKIDNGFVEFVDLSVCNIHVR